MKRVYVVFQSSSNTWSYPGDYDYDDDNYEDHFIEVYDNFGAAINSIRKWANSMARCNTILSRLANECSEEISIVPADPEDFENNKSYFEGRELKLIISRRVESVLLKSS